jgi:hypothetical protein
LVVLAVLAVAALVGGGSDSIVEARPCTNDATATAVRESTREVAGHTLHGIPDDEVQCRLRRALLTTAEMPDGLEPYEFELSGHIYAGRSFISSCRVELPYVFSGVTNRWYEEVGHRSVNHKVVRITPADGENFFAAIRHSCGLVQRDGPTTGFGSGRVISFPRFGDDTLAVDESFSDEDGTVNLFSIYIRQRDVLVALNAVDLTIAQTEALVRASAERLDSVGRLPELEPFAGEGCEPPEVVQMDPELDAALLRIDDLPAGWVEYTEPPCGSAITGGTCGDVSSLYPEFLVLFRSPFR